MAPKIKPKTLPMPTKRQQPTSTRNDEENDNSATTGGRQPRLATTTTPAATSSPPQQQQQHQPTRQVKESTKVSQNNNNTSSSSFLKLSASPSSDKFTPSNVVLLPSRAIEDLKLVVGSLVEVSPYYSSSSSPNSNHNNIASNSTTNPIILTVMRDTEQDRLRKGGSSSSSSDCSARFAASTLVSILLLSNKNEDDSSNTNSNNQTVIVKPFTKCDVDDLIEIVIRQRKDDEDSDEEESDQDDENTKKKKTNQVDLVEELQMFERSIPRDSGVASIIFEGMIVLCSSGTKMIEIEVVSIKFFLGKHASSTTTGYFTSSTKVKSERQVLLSQTTEEAQKSGNDTSTTNGCVKDDDDDEPLLTFIVGDQGSGKTTKLKKILQQKQKTSSSSKWISGGGIAALPSTKEKIQFLRSLLLPSSECHNNNNSCFFFDDIHLFLLNDDLVVAVFCDVIKRITTTRTNKVFCSVLSASSSSSQNSSKLRIEDIVPRQVISSTVSAAHPPHVEYLSLPSTEERIEIFTSLMKQEHESSSSSSSTIITQEVISDIAATAYGYSPLDFKVLIDVAKSYSYSSSSESSSTSPSSSIQITEQNLRKARRAVQPASLKSISAVSPPASITWNDIGGSDEAKQTLQECLAFANEKAQQQFAKFGVNAPRGVLLFGPPGCSKTLLAKALSSEGKMNFISVKGPEVFSKWVGDSEKAVRDIFDRARAAAPCLLFVDELDGMCGKRGGGGVGDRVISQLLVELDGLPKNSSSSSSSSSAGGIIFVAATNRPDVIDEAVLRPGRIDRKVYVGLPSLSDRTSIIKIALKGIPVAEEIKESGYLSDSGSSNSSSLPSLTEGYTGAEMVSLCKRAAALAVYEDVGADVVERRHFEQALKEVKPRIQQKGIDWYLNWANKQK